MLRSGLQHFSDLFTAFQFSPLPDRLKPLSQTFELGVCNRCCIQHRCMFNLEIHLNNYLSDHTASSLPLGSIK